MQQQSSQSGWAPHPLKKKLSEIFRQFDCFTRVRVKYTELVCGCDIYLCPAALPKTKRVCFFSLAIWLECKKGGRGVSSLGLAAFVLLKKRKRKNILLYQHGFVWIFIHEWETKAICRSERLQAGLKAFWTGKKRYKDIYIFKRMSS